MVVLAWSPTQMKALRSVLWLIQCEVLKVEQVPRDGYDCVCVRVCTLTISWGFSKCSILSVMPR